MAQHTMAGFQTCMPPRWPKRMMSGRLMPVTCAPWPNQKPTRSRLVASIARTMRSMASPQLTARQRSSPRRPSRTRGWTRRRPLCGISTAARPRMQRKPRLSGFSGSPVTVSTRPSADTSTSMPQNVGWQFMGHIVRTVRLVMGEIIPLRCFERSASASVKRKRAHITKEERRMKKYQLMAPGPTPVPPNVLLAMARPIIHHRAAEYDTLFREVREGLKRLVQTQQDVLTPACTGTGAMEAAVANTLSAGDRVIVVNAGAFAQRWLAICKAFGLAVVELEAPHGDTVSPDRIAQALREHADVKAVLVQHSESSTGVLHDVRGYAQATRGTGAILIVDAVSSLGIAELPMDAWGIDVVVSASQKGLMLPPGLGLLALSEKAWGAAKRSKLPKFYLDLSEERKYTARNEARFTPAVSIMVGLPKVLRRHDRLSRATRAGVEALGLTVFPKTTPSPALTAVQVPAGVDADRVVEGFATAHNITIDGGRGPTKGKIFRIGHMGYVADFDVTTALAALEQVLHDLGQPVDFGASLGAAQKVFAERG